MNNECPICGNEMYYGTNIFGERSYDCLYCGYREEYE